MAHDRRALIVSTPFRTIPAADGRMRKVLITENWRGRAVRVENFDKDGHQVGGTLQLVPDDLPAFLAALIEAAAAIGVVVPAGSAPQSERAALDRHLTRARMP